MKNKKSITLLVGEGNELTSAVCECLANEGIAAMVRQKPNEIVGADEQVKQLRGEAGKDLFFNGWTLLF